MLKSVDILLGLTVIMLALSMVVTVLTQFIIDLFNTRGRHLLHGLADLLQQIDPGIERNTATQITSSILTHPVIRSTMGRYGTTIHREEFTKLLMDIAAEAIPGNSSGKLDSMVTDRLKTTLKDNGIPNPLQTVDNVRSLALQLELSNPELANNTRQAVALMREANSKLVNKINGWFDQTIDRVADRFTATTRFVTVVCSFAVVGVTQLDTVALINRLSVDDELRSALVKKAYDLDAQSSAGETQGAKTASSSQPQTTSIQTAAKPPSGAPALAALSAAQPSDAGNKDKTKGESPAKTGASTQAPAEPRAPRQGASVPADPSPKQNGQALDKQPTGEAAQARWAALTDNDTKNIKQLLQLELITIPKDVDTWMCNWKTINLFGVFLSVVLLSLGAPFWYNALKELIRLRSTLAGKDDKQRLERQTTQTAAQPAAGASVGGSALLSSTSPLEPLKGERGILG